MEKKVAIDFLLFSQNQKRCFGEKILHTRKE